MSKHDLDIEKVGDHYILDPKREESIHISTVFLGVEKQLGQYETMIFGGQFDERQWRYDNLEAAQKGHLAVVLLVEASVGKCLTVPEEKKIQKMKEAAKEPDLPIRSISFEDDK